MKKGTTKHIAISMTHCLTMLKCGKECEVYRFFDTRHSQGPQTIPFAAATALRNIKITNEKKNQTKESIFYINGNISICKSVTSKASMKSQ